MGDDEESNQEVVITYETLFEMFRREKNRGELQELDEKFMQNVINYLMQKKDVAKKDHSNDDLFGDDDQINAEKQLRNIKKILKDLYERREKKIIEMALNKSRTQSPLIDDSALLKEEKVLFDNLVRVLDSQRQDILMNILSCKMPSISIKEENDKEDEKNIDVKLKFIEDMEEFVGPDMKVLGPYVKDDVATFPKNIADMLLNKGCAEPYEG